MPARYPAAAQTTINVTNKVDKVDGKDGKCTLREAIISANTNTAVGTTAGECPAGTGDDTIVLEAKVYRFNADNFGRGEDDAYLGDLDIRDNLTINGAGQGSTFIDADEMDRVLHILPGVPAGVAPETGPEFPVVFINDLTIRKGSTADEVVCITNCLPDPFFITNFVDGGGILNAGGDLTLTNVTVENNETGEYIDQGGHGGGIANLPFMGGPTGKQAGSPPVGFTRLFLTNTTVRNNRTADGFFEGGSGGGIYNVSGRVEIHTSTITQNRTGDGMYVGGHGGGLYNAGGVVQVFDSEVTDNTTGNGFLDRSATAKEGGEIDISVGGFGGGIYNGSLFPFFRLPPGILGSPFGRLRVEGTTVAGNTTGDGYLFGGLGGGVYNGDGFFFTMEARASKQALDRNRLVQGDEGPESNIARFFDAMVVENRTGNGEITDGFGGGLANDGGFMAVVSSTVASNGTGGGPGREGFIGGLGGGIYSGALFLDPFCDGPCETPTVLDGGDSFAILRVRDSFVTDNTTDDGAFLGGPGGGIFSGDLLVRDGFPVPIGEFSDDDNGLEAFLNDPELDTDDLRTPFSRTRVRRSLIGNNRTGDGAFRMTETFDGNFFGGGGLGGPGGGIATINGAVVARNATISGNVTGDGYLGGSGGGIFAAPFLSRSFNGVGLNNVTITNNRLGASMGGGDTLGPMEIGGGGFFAFSLLSEKRQGGGPPSVITAIQNTIIAQNRIRPGQAGPDCLGYFMSFGYNLIGDATDCFGFDDEVATTAKAAAIGDQVGTGDDPINPLLTTLQPDGTHHLLPGSSAIDRGSPPPVTTFFDEGFDCEETDQLGTERPIDGDGDEVAICDIGAFESPPINADLEVIKEVDNDQPDFGSLVTFTVTITNHGPAPIVMAIVTDVLPAGLTFESASPASDYNAASGEWTVLGLDVDESAVLTITARVDTDEPVTNTATVTESTNPDPNDENNSSSVTITPIAADLELDKRLEHMALNEDDTITAIFILTLTNHGPSVATGVEVTEELDPAMTILDAVPSHGTFDTVTGIWAIPTLNVGESATLVVTVNVPRDNEALLLNTAEVTASDQEDQDSNPGDGEGDDFDGAVTGRPSDTNRGRIATDLSLQKSVDNSTPTQGSEVTYTLTLSNSGPSPTAGVTVRDLLPAGLTFVSATPDGYDPATGIWTVDKLPNDSTVTLKITVRVDGTGEIINSAEVASSTVPDRDSKPNNDLPVEDDQDSARINVQAAQPKIVEEALPTEFELAPNYPNPFNPETVIPFALPEAAHVTIQVYDLLGRLVQTLADGSMKAGRHEVAFRADPLPTGVYLVRLQTADVVLVRRVTLMK